MEWPQTPRFQDPGPDVDTNLSVWSSLLCITDGFCFIFFFVFPCWLEKQLIEIKDSAYPAFSLTDSLKLP